uniref:Uncharacterized protein n=1 Tax=Bosea sp. NBC_00436 TaxID=2969620 RepID=A0A9E8A5T8_9HYPH
MAGSDSLTSRHPGNALDLVSAGPAIPYGIPPAAARVPVIRRVGRDPIEDRLSLFRRRCHGAGATYKGVEQDLGYGIPVLLHDGLNVADVAGAFEFAKLLIGPLLVGREKDVAGFTIGSGKGGGAVADHPVATGAGVDPSRPFRQGREHRFVPNPDAPERTQRILNPHRVGQGTRVRSEWKQGLRDPRVDTPEQRLDVLTAARIVGKPGATVVGQHEKRMRALHLAVLVLEPDDNMGQTGQAKLFQLVAQRPPRRKCVIQIDPEGDADFLIQDDPGVVQREDFRIGSAHQIL